MNYINYTMKYSLLLSALMAFVILAHSQPVERKIDHYLASNGIDYKKGDTITLGHGSDYNGNFRHFYSFSVGSVLVGNSGSKIGSFYSGSNVILKKIKQRTERGATSTAFFVNLEGSNYILYIENAIESCEVKDCKPKTPVALIQQQSVADEILKFKKLRDDGAITEDEYQKQKEKLLNKQ